MRRWKLYWNRKKKEHTPLACPWKKSAHIPQTRGPIVGDGGGGGGGGGGSGGGAGGAGGGGGGSGGGGGGVPWVVQ